MYHIVIFYLFVLYLNFHDNKELELDVIDLEAVYMKRGGASDVFCLTAQCHSKMQHN